MQAKQIKQGERYAEGRTDDYVTQVEVIKVEDHARQVSDGGRSFWSHTVTSKMVLCVRVQADGSFRALRDGERVSSYGHEAVEYKGQIVVAFWVLPAKIYRTWSEQVEINQAVADRNKAVENRHELDRQRLPIVQDEILKPAGVSIYRASAYQLGGKVELSFDELQAVIEHAVNAATLS